MPVTYRTPRVRPLLLGLNPSPVAPAKAWSEEASSTGALAYLAFDAPQHPGECQRWFDMRNLNEAITDPSEIWRIDPVEAMTRLAWWEPEGVLGGPIVTCGQAATWIVGAFRVATRARLGRVISIPHPSCLWHPHRYIPTAAWVRACGDLRGALGLPALAEPVDEDGIRNAKIGFGYHLDHLHTARILAEDAALAVASPEPCALEEAAWAEEAAYWRRQAADDEEESQIERFDAADSLIEEGRWHG